MSWLVLASGSSGEPWWISLIKAAIVINLVLFGFAYLTLIERKVMGRMQLRYGPNRVGPFGTLQPIADLVKLIRKESFFPAAAIDVLYILGPFLAAFTALTTFSVIPWGPGLDDRRVRGDRLRRRRVDLAAPDLRDRLDRDLRVHHRRLGVRLEVRVARLDADVRTARVVRGVARALRARGRDHGEVALARRHRRRARRRHLVRDPADRRFRDLHPRGHGRDRTRAVRPARGGAGARRRATTPSTEACASGSTRCPSTST